MTFRLHMQHSLTPFVVKMIIILTTFTLTLRTTNDSIMETSTISFQTTTISTMTWSLESFLVYFLFVLLFFWNLLLFFYFFLLFLFLFIHFAFGDRFNLFFFLFRGINILLEMTLTIIRISFLDLLFWFNSALSTR